MSNLISAPNKRKMEALELPHPNATVNRVAMAERFVAGMSELPMFMGELNVATLANLGPFAWALVAEALGENVPSEMTVAVIVGMVAAK